MSDHDEWKTEMRSKADELGLSLRAFAKLRRIQGLVFAIQNGSKFGHIALREALADGEDASSLSALSFVVECKWPNNPFYEPIAAFNSERVAEHYRDECRATNSLLEYRMRDLTPTSTQEN